jgi:heme exporter protein B
MLNADSVSGLRGEALGPLTLSLLPGTPTLSFIGAIGAALTLGMSGSSVLIAILLLPLFIPLLIVGAGAVTSSASVIGAGAHLLLVVVLAP